ncbi:hypothetical protein Q4I28_007778, partial [Leishmania naiffi]
SKQSSLASVPAAPPVDPLDLLPHKVAQRQPGTEAVALLVYSKLARLTRQTTAPPLLMASHSPPSAEERGAIRAALRCASSGAWGHGQASSQEWPRRPTATAHKSLRCLGRDLLRGRRVVAQLGAGPGAACS